MNFINRLSYFSAGFLIGLLFLMFFLTGKRTSCSYLPDSRVKKNISKKIIKFKKLKQTRDSTILLKVLREGKINFSKSNTRLKKCKEYYFNHENNTQKTWLIVESCEDEAEITSYEIFEN